MLPSPDVSNKPNVSRSFLTSKGVNTRSNSGGTTRCKQESGIAFFLISGINWREAIVLNNGHEFGVFDESQQLNSSALLRIFAMAESEAEVFTESVLTPDQPEEEKGISLEEWMEDRDAELMQSYTAYDAPQSGNVKVRAKTSQGQRTQSREFQGPYTANLIAESVYGGPAYAGSVPVSRQQRRGRSRGLPPRKIAPLTDTSKPKTAPAAIFLASPLNKQMLETKRVQSVEEKKLREEVERQKRDIALLRSQIKHRDEQLEVMNEEISRLKEGNKQDSDNGSKRTKEKSLESGPLSPNSVRLQALSKPRKVRPKVSASYNCNASCCDLE
jgi:hypothetical protein